MQPSVILHNKRTNWHFFREQMENILNTHMSPKDLVI
jgi:hypothetical protein